MDKFNKEKLNIPGLMAQKIKKTKWRIFIKVFHEEDLGELSEIYTKATDMSNKNKGLSIINEETKFLENGEFKILVKWGEWEIEGEDNEQSNY